MIDKPNCSLLFALLCILLPSCGNGGGGGENQKLRIGTLIGTNIASSNSVVSMTIFSDGTIEQVPGSPFAADGPPAGVAASAPSNLAFVGCDTGNLSGSLSVFKISAGGALSPVGPPITSGIVLPLTLSLTADSKFLLVNNGTSGAVIFGVDTATGSLTELPNLGTTGLSAFSPDGDFILSVSGSYLNSYSFNGSTGTVTLVSSAFDFFETLPTPPIVHPSGKFVYVPYSPAMIIGGTPPPGGIAGFALAPDGTLVMLPGSPFASGTSFGSHAGTAFDAAVIDPAGTHLYAESVGSVYGFTIDQTSGTLTPIAGASPFTGGSPLALAFDPSGRYLFVSQLGAIWSYSAGSDGVPTPVSGSPYLYGSRNHFLSCCSLTGAGPSTTVRRFA
jgi:6-phosphogluconolactonase